MRKLHNIYIRFGRCRLSLLKNNEQLSICKTHLHDLIKEINQYIKMTSKNITLHTKNVRRNYILICIKLKKFKKLSFKSFELKGVVINIYDQSVNTTILSVDIGKQLQISWSTLSFRNIFFQKAIKTIRYLKNVLEPWKQIIVSMLQTSNGEN